MNSEPFLGVEDLYALIQNENYFHNFLELSFPFSEVSKVKKRGHMCRQAAHKQHLGANEKVHIDEDGNLFLPESR